MKKNVVLYIAIDTKDLVKNTENPTDDECLEEARSKRKNIIKAIIMAKQLFSEGQKYNQ